MKELLNKIEQGHRFSISFEKRFCKLDKQYLIKNGKWDIDYSFDGEVIPRLQELYDKYYFSKPSERSAEIKHTYFRASDELTIGQQVLGSNREVARFELELFMLWIICNYKWEELFSEKQFFKGNNHMVVLKLWFENLIKEN